MKLPIFVWTGAGAVVIPMSFIGVTVYNSTSSNTISINKPAGTADDDIMFLVTASDTGLITSAPWWTSLWWTDTGWRYELWYRVASSEGASYTITNSTVNDLAWTIYVYRWWFNTSDPIDTSSNVKYIVSWTECRAASITVAKVNSPLFVFANLWRTASTTFSKPALPTGETWVEDYDGGATTSDYWRAVFSMQRTGSWATWDMDAIMSVSTTNKHAFAVALNP